MTALQKDRTSIQTKMTQLLTAIQKNKVNEQDLIKSIDKHDHEILQTLQDDWKSAIQQIPKEHDKPQQKEKRLIPPNLKRLFAGMARVPRDDFFQQYDLGVPKDDTMRGNDNVLLLYSNDKAIPHDGIGIPLLSVENATE